MNHRHSRVGRRNPILKIFVQTTKTIHHGEAEKEAEKVENRKAGDGDDFFFSRSSPCLAQ
jgi:hypothetical protein